MIKLTYKHGNTETVEFEGGVEKFLQWRRDLLAPPDMSSVVKIEDIGVGYLIFDRETNRAYTTTMPTTSERDLLTKFILWDMESDPEEAAKVIADIKTDKDADDYFRDRGSVVLQVDDIETF